MKATRVSAYVFAVAASLTGAACTGTGQVEYAGQVTVTSPDLIEVSPGVEVVADADEPLFYSSGYYYLYRDGYWLRSNDYQTGFARIDVSYVPVPVRRIDRPQAYVQYRRHHGRDFSARANPEPTRSRPDNRPYYNPPPNQGVPSTPVPDTWEPNGTRPVPHNPQPTPPITYPGNVHGNPMPPRNDQQPIQARPSPAPDRDEDRGDHEHDHGSRPPDRHDQATPPAPPVVRDNPRDDRARDNQERVRENQDRARENQERARENQDRARENQDRAREQQQERDRRKDEDRQRKNDERNDDRDRKKHDR